MLKTSVLVGTMVMVGSIGGAWNASADTARDSRVLAVDREAIRLVEEVEEVGQDVRYHAERLMDLANQAGLSAWTHCHHLDEVKILVNRSLRPALQRLVEIQQAQPEWKQESIDRMIAAARQLAADASSAYLAKSKNPNVPPILNEGYRQFIAEVADHAGTLAKTADAAHSVAVAQMKAHEAGLPIASK